MKPFLILVAFSLLLLVFGCNYKPTLFEEISSSHSGIDFNNKIIIDRVLINIPVGWASIVIRIRVIDEMGPI